MLYPLSYGSRKPEAGQLRHYVRLTLAGTLELAGTC